MSSPFAITTTTNTVSLDSNRQGQTSFTVSNTTKRAVRGHASIVARPESSAPWLTLQDEAERSFVGAGSQQYSVQIAIPADAKAGEYTFQLNVADMANPDENFSQGPTVRFTVEEPSAPQKKPFPWWIVLAIIGGLILLIGGTYSIVRVNQKAPTAIAQATTTATVQASTTASTQATGTITPANATVTATATATPVPGVTPIPLWLKTTPMPTARFGLASVLGPKGLIYAVGGYSSIQRTPLATLEVYNPTNNSWTSLAPMPTARYDLSAVLGPDGRIYVIGGIGVNGVLNTVEAYDPKTNTWTTVAPLPSALALTGAVLGNDGQIYIVGGYNPGNPGTNAVESYNPLTNAWTALAPLHIGRYALAAVLGSDGQIYALGGANPRIGGDVLPTVEVYDPLENTWTVRGSMPSPRANFAATVGPDGQIYVIGGQGAGFVYQRSVEVYDLNAASWSVNAAPLPDANAGFTAVLGPDGRIYAIGGSNPNGTSLQTVEIYDTTTNSWTPPF
jgi:N-acetylneuraminic acid mutarotase